jgi:exopolyphosphatase/guanosine-5'-triphosphate,3'-diphosphate pyrophosphatase
MKRVSCIDVGTNTALLLIADLDPESGDILPVHHEQTIVRLGKNVDERKMIERAALDRLLRCLFDYRTTSFGHGAETIIAAGTSALRDAGNRTAIIDEVFSSTGICLQCLSGREEAELTFFGAVAGLTDIPEPFSVIDIGGGSTEIIMGTKDTVSGAVSLDIGSVRLTERFFSSLPPTGEAFTRAVEEINRQLTAGILPFFEAREHVYGVAGTLTTIAQVSMGSRLFIPEKVHRYVLDYDHVSGLLERLRHMTLEEIAALGIPEGRADVFTMGTLILRQFMRLLGLGTVTVSIQGLRFGLAQKELLRLRHEAGNPA